MAIHIRDPEAERLIRELADRTGETMTAAVVVAVRDRLAREERRTEDIEALVEEAMAIGRHCALLPVRDSRSGDEILYDEHGLPT
jgi:antitoxin VapB